MALLAWAPVAEAAFPGQNGKIAYTSNESGSHQIYLMNADGSGAVRVTDPPGVSTRPGWSPDGAKIAFQSTRDGNDEIYVMNADGSGETRITNNSGRDFSPAWSPDGTQLLFIWVACEGCTPELWAMDSDGTDRHLVFTRPYSSSEPDWAPDGTRIAFWHLEPGVDGERGIYTANPDGTDFVNVIPYFSPSYGWGQTTAPNWSPDSKRIAFMHDECGDECFEGGAWAVYTANRDGSGRVGPISYGRYPEWSPDNGNLLFAEDSDCSFNPFGGVFSCETQNIVVENVATGTRTNLTNT